MNSELIEQNIELFRNANPFGDTLEHCFVPWYLTERFGISGSVAIKQSADTNNGLKSAGYDKNVDGFHLEKKDEKITLFLIQGKYSADINYISSGIKDFTKTIEWLKSNLIHSSNEIGQENKVLRNLRAEFQQLTEDEKKIIILEFVVIHKCDLDHISIMAKTNAIRKSIEQEIREEIPSHDYKLSLEGPNEILSLQPTIKKASPSIEINFQGIKLGLNDNASQMFLGIGKLSDIIGMYNERRDDLFSKNVRLFITSKKNTEKGPSAKIKETLKSMSINSSKMEEPSKFAFLHNGITIEARDVKILDNDKLSMRDPFVLNGCQTIMASYLFGQKQSEKIDKIKWEQITLPIRIIDTSDENFVRKITITTNRQNPITASALRSNSSEQLGLETDFKKIKIFYERQEGAFEYLQDNNPKMISEQYSNSEWGPVYIEDIARALAAISGEFGIAKNVTDLFESDAAYDRCFSPKRIHSKHLLVFLQNVSNVLPLVLRNDLALDWKISVIKTGAIHYYIMCLLMRHLVKSKQLEFVEEYGREIWGKNQHLRNALAKHLDNRHSGIKGQIKERFMTLADTSQSSVIDAFKKMSNTLRLTDTIDCFTPFENFDEQLDT